MEDVTVRELIKQLEDMDEDVKDYKVRVHIVKQWNSITTIVEGEITEVPEHCNVDMQWFTLEAR